MAPAFLQPRAFWDIWDLSDSLSSRLSLSFQQVPGHTGLPSNKLANSLAKIGATLPFTYVPSSPDIRRPDMQYSVFSFYRISGIRLSGNFAIRQEILA